MDRIIDTLRREGYVSPSSAGLSQRALDRAVRMLARQGHRFRVTCIPWTHGRIRTVYHLIPAQELDF